MSTGRQAKLYAGTDDTGVLLGAVNVEARETGAPVTLRHGKGDDGWSRVLGVEARQTRITADGPSTDVVYTLLRARYAAGSVDPYYLEFGEGDAHQGDFVVEAIDAVAIGDDRRRFRVSLTSSGGITYTPA